MLVHVHLRGVWLRPTLWNTLLLEPEQPIIVIETLRTSVSYTQQTDTYVKMRKRWFNRHILRYMLILFTLDVFQSLNLHRRCPSLTNNSLIRCLTLLKHSRRKTPNSGKIGKWTYESNFISDDPHKQWLHLFLPDVMICQFSLNWPVTKSAIVSPF